MTYAVIAKVKKDETLLTGQAFASLSLVSLATTPLIRICEALPSCLQAVACFKNIEEYCLKAPVEPSPSNTIDSSRTELEMSLQSPISAQKTLFSFKDAEIAWAQEDSESVLHGIEFDITPGFTAIMGPVAAGKSTLLAAIIGETVLVQGSASESLTSVAFCSQTPWITDESIRRNITGDLELDEKWYNFTVNTCCLRKDLDRLPKGDETHCGSNGASLSGGQRQRVVRITPNPSVACFVETNCPMNL